VRPTKGLTIIEIMIALAVLGVMVTFIASSLAGSFQLTRENRRSLDATSNTQRILEDIRGQWRDPMRFDTACAEVTLNSAATNFMTVSATSTNLNRLAVATATPAAVATPTTCPGTALAACDTPMKRVIVTAVDSGDATRVLARATLDVNCPTEPRP
jgi:prepilin-type N-terminal cleavage/methylation domain-containing protein